MRILLTESEHGVGDATQQTLERAGHQVVRCSERDAPDFPCNGLATGDCPIDDHVDAAVTVRAQPDATPTPRETGVICALRQRIPLVVARAADADPFVTWSTATVVSGDETALLTALDDALSGELPEHARVAAAEARDRLADDAVEADARRRGNGIAVTVRTSVWLDPQRRETLGVHVAGAVRRHDRWAGVIDVAVLDGSDTAG